MIESPTVTVFSFRYEIILKSNGLRNYVTCSTFYFLHLLAISDERNAILNTQLKLIFQKKKKKISIQGKIQRIKNLF